MSRIAGRYTTRRDGGIGYSYDATWQEAAAGVIWSATVKRGGEFAGAPNGQIRHTFGIKLADEVKRLVEESIERKLGVG